MKESILITGPAPSGGKEHFMNVSQARNFVYKNARPLEVFI